MAEWSKATASKAVILVIRNRGFESHPLHQACTKCCFVNSCLIKTLFIATEILFIKEYVILVDEKDVAIGQQEKLQTHLQGLLHRAFSIFIFNKNKQLLLQKRADVKYHSPGLWSNTCCGHPIPEESLEKAAARRLFEEMGIKCPLYYAGKFTYRAEFSKMNLIEHEIDHLFYGFFDNLFIPNNDEVALTRWISYQKLLLEFRQVPYTFTAWFEQALQTLNSTGHVSSNF